MKINKFTITITAIIILSLTFLFLSADKKISLEREITIVALGDSLTEGTGVPGEDSYPAQLQNKLTNDGIKAKIINKGISGDTSAGVLGRVDEIIDLKPDIVILAIGSNDGLRRMDPEITKNNISNIIEKLKSNDIEILFCGTSILLSHGLKYASDFKSIFKELAKEHNLEFMPIILKGVTLNPDLNTDDSMHPNKDGYAVIVKNMYPYLENILKKL